ncbi:MAG: metal-dependent hydrolase [Methyloligellaceae bacterium]
MKITWYGHSCFKVETGTSSILMDPFLTGNSTFEALGKSVDEVAAGVTHLALTHGHDDHIGDTLAICKQSGAKLIANYEIAMYLGAQGLENVSPMNPGGTVAHTDFNISLVNAVHSSSTIVDGSPVYLGAACGVVISTKEMKTIYHMGDTDIFSDMALIEELYSPDIGIVPIGDRFTMGARSAALACKKFFNFKTVIPCHYGTFPIIDPDAGKFVAEMEGENVIVPDAGEVLSA